MKKLSIKFISLILILSIIVTFIHSFLVKSEVSALSDSYTQYIKSGINAFPESYQIKLAYLKYLHPEWEFKAYYTGIDWNELTSSSVENRCGKNTIQKNTTLDPSALCICGKLCDNGGYYCASAKTVNYYLDPRNFLGEAMVFQFLDLSNASGISREMVEKATTGTYLSAYVDDIMAAATEAGINPIHIVATIFQELGKTGMPRAISGTVPGYEGLYNFYNYGATDGDGAVERGLEKARELGWTTPRYALIDGAKRVLANSYISAGQITKYFYKFDVVANEILTESMGTKTYKRVVNGTNQFFDHQYMTNLRDPSSQAGILYDIYADNGILDQKMTFMIPVYNNMPSTVYAPTTLTATSEYGLFAVNSMKKWGVSFRSSPGGASLGNIYKDTVVLHMGNEGDWSKVKICMATDYNADTKKWNYIEKIGYISTEYVGSIGGDVPDYRDKVDMGGVSVNPNPTGNAELKIDGDKLMMTPSTTSANVKNKYPGAVLKWSDGSLILGSDTMLGTGGLVEISGKMYVCIKIGDVNCDGFVDARDALRVLRFDAKLVGINENYMTALDVNRDGEYDARDALRILNYEVGKSEVNL